MAASELEIYNRALQILGASQLSSVGDQSKSGRACRACYSVRRDALLRRYRWRFAIKRATLAADVPAPEWGRANSFTLPADCLRVIPTYPETIDINSDWEIEADRKILTNDNAPLYVRYIARIENAGLMDPLFREALSADMAVQMAEELTQSTNKKESAREDFDRALSEAKKTNSIEVPPTDSPESPWITVRN